MTCVDSLIYGVVNEQERFVGTAFQLGPYVVTCAHVAYESPGFTKSGEICFLDVVGNRYTAKLAHFSVDGHDSLNSFQKLKSAEVEKKFKDTDRDIAIFEQPLIRRSADEAGDCDDALDVDRATGNYEALRLDTVDRPTRNLEGSAPFFPRKHGGEIEWINAQCIGDSAKQYLFAPEMWENGFSGAPVCDERGNILGIVTRYRLKSSEGQGGRFRVVKSTYLRRICRLLHKAHHDSVLYLTASESRRHLSSKKGANADLLNISFQTQPLEIEDVELDANLTTLKVKETVHDLLRDKIDRLLIVGDSGCGKTTFLRRMTMDVSHYKRKPIFYIFVENYEFIKLTDSAEETYKIILETCLVKRGLLDKFSSEIESDSFDEIFNNFQCIIIFDNIDYCGDYKTASRVKNVLPKLENKGFKVILSGITCPHSKMFINERTSAYRLTQILIEDNHNNRDISYFEEAKTLFNSARMMDLFIFNFVNSQELYTGNIKGKINFNPIRDIKNSLPIQRDTLEWVDEFSFNKLLFGLEILGILKCFHHLIEDDIEEFLYELIDFAKYDVDLFDLIDIVNRTADGISYISSSFESIAGYNVEFVHTYYRDYFAARYLDRLSKNRKAIDQYQMFMRECNNTNCRRAIVFSLSMNPLNRSKNEILKIYFDKSKQVRQIGFIFLQLLSYGVKFDNESYNNLAKSSIQYYFEDWYDSCLALFSNLDGYVITKTEFYNLYQMPSFQPMIQNYSKENENSLARDLLLLAA